jgi:hypothetical protein
MWQGQGLWGNEIRMLEGKPTSQGRMTGRIRHHHPSGTRRKIPNPLPAAILKFLVGFQEIMKAKHELVVRRPPELPRPEDAEHSCPQKPGPIGALGTRQANLVAIKLEQFAKRLGGRPSARLCQIDVGKDAQNSPAVGRPTGKGIDVEKIVPGR